MDKIKPQLYITDTDPVPEAVLSASNWFQTEYTYLEVTEEDRGMLGWMLAQGWVVYQSGVTRLVGRSNTEITGYKYWLRRRKLQSERVLNDLIREFTEAYNEGREINDRRYDELVTLYDAMLDKTEDEINTAATATTAATVTIEGIIALLPADFASMETDVDAAVDGFESGREAEINIQFDNKRSEASQALMDRGMYNSTVWTSVAAGIELHRARALTDLENTLSGRKIDAVRLVHGARDSMRRGVLAAHERLMAAKRDHALTPVDFRNRVLSAMLAFMERRTDEYPGLEGLAGIAGQLGYGEGGASAPPV